MITTAQGELIIDLVRRHGRMLRGESFKTLRFLNALVRAREADVPEGFLLPFGVALHKTIDGTRFDAATLPPSVGALFAAGRRWRTKNLAALDAFAEDLRVNFQAKTEDAILAGDGAALSGLYEDPGAFPGAHWAALLPDGTYAASSRKRKLALPADDWSEKIRFGKNTWRKPRPDLVVTLLAAHLGNPSAPPMPSMWPHLGLALLAWKDRLSVRAILEFARALDVVEDVRRGLAITAHIFPELEAWANVDELSIPGWEQKLAIPLAARRLMAGDRD